MVRSITDTLAVGIREKITHWDRIPLKTILTKFWSGSVRWTAAAQQQLDFWSEVDFLSLEAPISRDVLGKSLEAVFTRPWIIDHTNVACLFQDASQTAAGGGRLVPGETTMLPTQDIFLAMFSAMEQQLSSTL